MQNHFYAVAIFALDLEIFDELRRKKNEMHEIVARIGFIALATHLRQREGHLRFREFATDAASHAHRERQSGIRVLHALIRTVLRPDPSFRLELVRFRKIVPVTAARVNRHDNQVLEEMVSLTKVANIFVHVIYKPTSRA